MAFVLFGLSGLFVTNKLVIQISVLARYVPPHECLQTGLYWRAYTGQLPTTLNLVCTNQLYLSNAEIRQ